MKPSPETMRARMYDDRGALIDSDITACRAAHLLLYFYMMHSFLDSYA